MLPLPKIQSLLEILADEVLLADIPEDGGMPESYDFHYSMKDYANLSIVMNGVLSANYLRNLANVCDSPFRYLESDDMIARREALNAPFVYHLGKTIADVFNEAYPTESITNP